MGNVGRHQHSGPWPPFEELGISAASAFHPWMLPQGQVKGNCHNVRSDLNQQQKGVDVNQVFDQYFTCSINK